MMAPTLAWKLVLAVALAGTIFASAWAKAPRRSLAITDLRCLVAAALLLYGVGVACALAHHAVLGVLMFAAGISASTLAAWLSRGADGSGPSEPEAPTDAEPPRIPGDPTGFDWTAFEREFRAYERRHRDGKPTPVG